MNEDDDKLLRRYRDIARDEPPPAIDAAVLAASRRAVASRPWSKRLAAPVSIAAVLMLAIGVTLEMQREQPGVEVAMTAAETASAPKPAPAAPPPQPAPTVDALRDDAQKSKPAARVAPPQVKALKKEAAPPATEPPAQARLAPSAEMAANRAVEATAESPPPDRAAMQAPPASEARAKRALTGPTSLVATPPPPPPEAATGALALPDLTAELERIARLRTEGRHEEADKALDEFQRKHPGYRIPDAMWDRVKRR